jgi:hypothetical protein
MNRKSQNPLVDRVAKAAEAALAAQGYVSPTDALVGIGWLDVGAVERWRRGQIDCLERAMQTNLPRVLEALKLFQSWRAGRGLSASLTDYLARTPQRQTLRFSRSGDPAVEVLYRTHWVSQKLSETKRQRLAKPSRAPDLLIVQPLQREWTGMVGRSYLEPYTANAMRYLVPALHDFGEMLKGRKVTPIGL